MRLKETTLKTAQDAAQQTLRERKTIKHNTVLGVARKDDELLVLTWSQTSRIPYKGEVVFNGFAKDLGLHTLSDEEGERIGLNPLHLAVAREWHLTEDAPITLDQMEARALWGSNAALGVLIEQHHCPLTVTLLDHEERDYENYLTETWSWTRVQAEAGRPSDGQFAYQHTLNQIIQSAEGMGDTFVSATAADGSLLYHADVPALIETDKMLDALQALYPAEFHNMTDEQEKQIQRLIKVLKDPFSMPSYPTTDDLIAARQASSSPKKRFAP